MPAKAHCASRIAKKIFARRASQAKSPAQPTTSNVRHATPTTSARNAERAIHCPVAANAPATTTTTAPTGAPSAMKAVASASTASATPTATEPTSASSASASIVGSVARYPFLEGLEQTLPLEMGISRGPLPPPLRVSHLHGLDAQRPCFAGPVLLRVEFVSSCSWERHFHAAFQPGRQCHHAATVLIFS